MTFNKIFIVGCGRSGTSWVFSIFLNHPEVIGNKWESKLYQVIGPFLSENVHPNWKKKVIDDYRSFTGRLKAYVTEEELLGFIRQIDLEKSKDNEKAQALIDLIIDNFFKKNGGTPGQVFVEKTPFHIHYADKILDRYPESRIVEVIRDGRDVCASLQSLGADWCPKRRIDQIRFWKKAILKGKALQDNDDYKNRILQVRYEQLRRDPKRAVKRLFDFSGIDSNTDLVDNVLRLTDINNFKNRGEGKHIAKGDIGGWKNKFSEHDINVFKREAGKLLCDLGYTW